MGRGAWIPRRGSSRERERESFRERSKETKSTSGSDFFLLVLDDLALIPSFICV